VGDVLPFEKPSPKKKAHRKTMCKHGFHKWAPDAKKQFDVKQGKLVTLHRCTRCGTTKTTLT
jgi:hypothetical protein